MKRIERNMVHSMRERADERAEEKREERRREKREEERRYFCFQATVTTGINSSGSKKHEDAREEVSGGRRTP